jgi:hypothetical protein
VMTGRQSCFSKDTSEVHKFINFYFIIHDYLCWM